MLRGYGNTHVHMLRHEMPFKNLAFLLLGKGVEHGSQLSADRPENRFPPSFRVG